MHIHRRTHFECGVFSLWLRVPGLLGKFVKEVA